MAQDTTAFEAARGLLEGALSLPPGPLPLTPLAGDASTRRFLRVGPLEGAPASAILMAMGPSGGCEEHASTFDPAGEMPFLQIQSLLKARGVPVPEILAADRARGWVLLEDLGDETLAQRVQTQGLDAALPLYEDALRHLARLQAGGLPTAEESPVIAGRDFDEALFRWEFDHYIEFALVAEFGPLEPTDLGAVEAELGALSEALGALPKVVVHRDYHARNLMVRGEGVVVIDFQDALPGPAAYDVMSLLGDAYVCVPEDTQAELLDVYRHALKSEGAEVPNAGDLRRALDLATFHRSLKAAGRFAFFKHVRGNDAYMASVPQALANARAAALRHSDLEALCRILARYDTRLAP